MRWTRFLRHLFATRRELRVAFDDRTLAAIEQAVRESEHQHGGEIRFVIEGALDTSALWHGATARQRAHHVFAELNVWDTERNNGVLLYVLLADRAVEIVADRGYSGRVEPAQWRAACLAVEAEFRHGRYLTGAVAGVDAVGRIIAHHFPAAGGHRNSHGNELPDRPALL
jgi:uncharacterized membrane protein